MEKHKNVFLRGDKITLGGTDESCHQLGEISRWMYGDEQVPPPVRDTYWADSLGICIAPFIPNEVTLTGVKELTKNSELKVSNLILGGLTKAGSFITDNPISRITSLNVYNNDEHVIANLSEFTNVEKTYISKCVISGLVSSKVKDFSFVNCELLDLSFEHREKDNDLYIYIWMNNKGDGPNDSFDIDAIIHSIEELGKSSPETPIVVDMRDDAWASYCRKNDSGHINHDNKIEYREFCPAESC